MLGEPPPPSLPSETGGDTGSGTGHGFEPNVGPGVIVQLEARVQNALWTPFPDVPLGLDVGVGRRTVWVAPEQVAQVARIDARTGKQVPSVLAPGGGAKRISVSRPKPGSDDEELGWAVDAFGFVRMHTGSWLVVGSPGAIDVAAGAHDYGREFQKGGQNVFRVSASGKVERLLVLDQLNDWFPLESAPFQTSKASWPSATTVAVERAPVGLDENTGLHEVWFIRTDDQVGRGSSPHQAFAQLPGGAWDIGASDDGVVWAIGTTESPDVGSRGNTLWRLDRDAERWDWISPGWGIALDVDEDGNPWVIDSDGRLHVRGKRMPGVAGGVRGAPKDPTDADAWAEYLNAYGDTVASALGLQAIGPGLQPESTAQARSLGAGGSILLLPWDELTQQAKARIEKALAKDPGLEALFCLAPIFTTLPRVPQHLLAVTGAFNGKYVDFSNSKLIEAYIFAVSLLAAIPGFTERVRYFSVGNEVDVHLGGFPGQVGPWTGFTTFCQSVVPEVKKLLPRAKVGVNWTFPGIRTFPAAWKAMAEPCDALFINYYAVDAGKPNVPPTFDVLDEPTYTKDFIELLDLPAKYHLDKPIVLQEVGMPTDDMLCGSEEKQRDFVLFLFEQWDKAGILVPFLSWFQLYDFLYDENLKVDASSGALVVTQNTSPYPTTFTYYGQTLGPFWGLGNEIAYAFRPFDPNKVIPTLEEREDLINLSTAGGAPERLCRFLSRCGLIDQTGASKPAWDVYQAALAKRRRQL